MRPVRDIVKAVGKSHLSNESWDKDEEEELSPIAQLDGIEISQDK